MAHCCCSTGAGLGAELDALLLEDVPLLVTVAAWATTCAFVLALG